MKLIRKNLAYLLPIFILFLALGIRLIGVNHDLPFLYDFDEPIFVDRARHMLTAKDLNPRWFGAPASTLIYLLMLTYGLIFAVGSLFGIFSSPSEFGELYYADPSIFYLSGRLLGVLFGVGTVGLTYWIGKKIFKSDLLAASAAILVALCPVMISNAKVVRMDMMMTFLLLTAFLFCIRILEKEPADTLKEYCTASFITGLAIVTKYPAIIFVATIIATYLLGNSWKRKGWEKISYSTGACIFGCFIGSPFIFLDFGQVLNDVAFESRSQHIGATGEGLINNISWYITTVIPNNFTYAAIPFIFLGLIACITSRNPRKIILTIFPLTFILFISSLSLRWERWLIPILPFLSLILTYGILKFSLFIIRLQPLKENIKQKNFLMILFFMSLILLPMLNISSIEAKELSAPDTRTEARNWMLENLPRNSSLLMEVYTPQLPKDHFQYHWVEDSSIVYFDANFSKDLTFRPRWSIVGKVDFSEIQERNIDYIVLSNRYQKYVEEKDANPEILNNYEEILKHSRSVYKNESVEGKSRGPGIEIYEISKQLN